MALRWGIAAAGRITHDFVNALATLPEGEHTVVAVGERELAPAEDFAKRFGIPKAYGSFLELAQDPNVEVVYIGVINILHYELARLFLEHGKHVLVEKPMCMNLKRAKEIIAFAKEKKLFFMEAIWSRFFPAHRYIIEQIKSGKLGEIESIYAEFGDDMKHVERIM